MPRYTDADGEWEAELNPDGTFRSGYLINPSPAYEARRQAAAAAEAAKPPPDPDEQSLSPQELKQVRLLLRAQIP